MSGRWRRIFAVMQKEILHVFRDNITFMIAFLAPIVLGALLSFIYIEQKVTNLPVAVYDQDQSEMSRMIIQAFSDSERFKIAKTCHGYQEIERLMQSEEICSAIIIPPHLQQNIKAGKSSEVGLIFNGTNILTMNTLATTAGQVVQTISAGVTMKVMQGYGITQQKAYQAVTALNFRSRYWYNPTTSYSVFMVLGLFGVLIQQITFLGVALSFVREKENGSWRHLAFSGLSPLETMAGKLLVYFLIYCIDALALYGAGFVCLGLPMHGNALLFIFTLVLFIFVLLAVGMAISIITQSAAQAIEISMLIAVPSFLISGWTWPCNSMPWLLRGLSKILPLTHFLEAIRRIAYLGAGLDIVWPKLLILSLFGIICIPVTMIILHHKMLRG
jgi:ABC-2 type transport system permease protein